MTQSIRASKTRSGALEDTAPTRPADTEMCSEDCRAGKRVENDWRERMGVNNTTLKGVLTTVNCAELQMSPSADLIRLHLVSDPKYRSLRNMIGENEDDVEAGRSRRWLF